MTKEELIKKFKGVNTKVMVLIENTITECEQCQCTTDEEVEDFIDNYVWMHEEDFQIFEDLVRAAYPEHNPNNMMKMLLCDIVTNHLFNR